MIVKVEILIDVFEPLEAGLILLSREDIPQAILNILEAQINFSGFGKVITGESFESSGDR